MDMLTLDKAKETIAHHGIRSSMVRVSDLDVVVDTAGSVEIRNGGKAFGLVNRTAYTSVGDHLGIDAKDFREYLDDPDLANRMIKHSLHKRKDAQLMMVTNHEGIEFFANSQFAWLSPEEVFGHLEATIGDQLVGIQSIMPAKHGLQIKAITHVAAQPAARVGDINHAGIWMSSNGYVETGSYVLRLACTNGAIREYRRSSANSRDALGENVRSSIRSAFDDARDMLAETMDLINKPADNPTATIHELTRRSGSGGARVLERLVAQLPTLQEAATMYDVLQLVTVQAHETKNIKYEWLGGDAVKQFAAHSCNRCGQKV